jgi:hypothetical protein
MVSESAKRPRVLLLRTRGETMALRGRRALTTKRIAPGGGIPRTSDESSPIRRRTRARKADVAQATEWNDTERVARAHRRRFHLDLRPIAKTPRDRRARGSRAPHLISRRTAPDSEERLCFISTRGVLAIGETGVPSGHWAFHHCLASGR